MKLDDVDVSAPVVVTRRRMLQAGGWAGVLLASGGFARRSLDRRSLERSSPPSSRARGSAVVVAVPDLEVQIFQTAASLENVLVDTYAAILASPMVGDDQSIGRFVETTMQHHTEHAAAFNDQAEALGGARQDALNPRYAGYLGDTLPTVADAAGLLAVIATLEEVVTDTYLEDLTRLADPSMRTLMASVMSAESQHLGTLRVFASLIATGVAGLVAIPTDVVAFPADVGDVASPRGVEIPNLAVPPSTGAVS